jgi:hypothetical protein
MGNMRQFNGEIQMTIVIEDMFETFIIIQKWNLVVKFGLLITNDPFIKTILLDACCQYRRYVTHYVIQSI